MTTVEAEVLDEFDLDIQIDETDETDPPVRKHAPRAYTGTKHCSCTGCCPSVWCYTAGGCSQGCN
jgi:hypothetical protein